MSGCLKLIQKRKELLSAFRKTAPKDEQTGVSGQCKRPSCSAHQNMVSAVKSYTLLKERRN